MRSSLRLLVGIMLLLALPLFSQAQGIRQALVIGNGTYADLGKLRNPVNDATDIAAALGRLGFKATLITYSGKSGTCPVLCERWKGSLGCHRIRKGAWRLKKAKTGVLVVLKREPKRPTSDSAAGSAPARSIRPNFRSEPSTPER